MITAERPVQQVRRWAKGERLDHAKLNEPVDAINRIVGGSPYPRQVRRPRIGNGGSPTGVLRIKQLYVAELVYAVDYIKCSTETGGLGDEYFVALPWMFRYTPFHLQERAGITYDYSGVYGRTATNTEDETETQVIVPDYIVNDLLTVIGPVNTGVTITVGDEDHNITWLDLNVDGRAWMREWESA